MTVIFQLTECQGMTAVYDSINVKTGLLFNSHMIIISVMSIFKSQFIIFMRKGGICLCIFFTVLRLRRFF